ncbi:MAG: hypothetical protein ACXVW2_14535 [Nocardioidaceae bacterium]
MTSSTSDAELEQLRARVAELEAELQQAGEAAPPTPPPTAGRLRSVFAVILITLACVFAPFSVVAVWANTQVSDTNRYVATVSPLAKDPSVQNVIATKVTAAILTNINVRGLTTDALNTLASQPRVPPRVAALLPGLAVPITNGVDGFVGTQVHKIVVSPQFAKVWDQANRVAHQELVNLLEGKQGGAVSAQNNTVTLNLAPIIAKVKQRLVASGFGLASKIPTINKTIVLVRSDAVTKAQGFYRLLNTLGLWLPIITLVLFAGGIALARDRRRALATSGFGLAGSMLVLGVGLVVARVLYLNAVPSNVLPSQAAGDVYDTLVRFLRYGLRAVLALGLVVGLGAYLTGGGTAAVRTRAAFAGGIGRLRGSAEGAGMRTGAVGSWIFAHKRALRWGTVILAALILVLWSRPTVAVILWLTVAVLVVLAVIEFLGRPPASAQPVGAEPVAGPEAPTLPRQMPREPQEPPAAPGDTEAGAETGAKTGAHAGTEAGQESSPRR